MNNSQLALINLCHSAVRYLNSALLRTLDNRSDAPCAFSRSFQFVNGQPRGERILRPEGGKLNHSCD